MARPLSLIVTIFCLLASAFGQCTLERASQYYKRSVYEFNADLVLRINQETESHFIASGLSPWALISAISLGAADETLEEITQVLKLHPHKCFNNKYLQLAAQTTHIANDTILEKSSALFIDEGLLINENFKNAVRRTGVCDINAVSFDNIQSTAAIINDYVSKATHEAIDEIVEPNDLDGVYMIIIDALFFKGAWKIQFHYEDTELSPFYNERGNQIGDVNLMYVSGDFNWTSIQQIRAEILELPYGDQNRYSMLIFLPFRDVSVTNVIDNLNRISLSSVFTLFQRHGPETVAVQIPRFKITSDINNLKELLIDMGLKTMFSSTQAKFPDISDLYELYVSNLVQKADIEVTEDGTVASAASAATLESRMMPTQFLANKPFIFMIVDRYTEVALFTGAYSKPNVY